MNCGSAPRCGCLLWTLVVLFPKRLNFCSRHSSQGWHVKSGQQALSKSLTIWETGPRSAKVGVTEIQRRVEVGADGDVRGGQPRTTYFRRLLVVRC